MQRQVAVSWMLLGVAIVCMFSTSVPTVEAAPYTWERLPPLHELNTHKTITKTVCNILKDFACESSIIEVTWKSISLMGTINHRLDGYKMAFLMRSNLGLNPILSSEATIFLLSDCVSVNEQAFHFLFFFASCSQPSELLEPARRRGSRSNARGLGSSWSKSHPYPRSCQVSFQFWTLFFPFEREKNIEDFFLNLSSKRGLDLGLSRGFSGSQAAKHLMGLAAANYAGGPGRRRRSEQA